MIRLNHKIVIASVLVIGVYGLSWLLFFVDNGFVRNRLASHYGPSYTTCEGGVAGNRDSSGLQSSWIVSFGGNDFEAKNFLTPFLLPTTDFRFDLNYQKGKIYGTATGQIDYLGHIRQVSDYHDSNAFLCSGVAN